MVNSQNPWRWGFIIPKREKSTFQPKGSGLWRLQEWQHKQLIWNQPLKPSFSNTLSRIEGVTHAVLKMNFFNIKTQYVCLFGNSPPCVFSVLFTNVFTSFFYVNFAIAFDNSSKDRTRTHRTDRIYTQSQSAMEYQKVTVSLWNLFPSYNDLKRT